MAASIESNVFNIQSLLYSSFDSIFQHDIFKVETIGGK
jgi:hypothetical protein